ncbi:hypothetical protein PtA15_5A637 [Puccinia triticina]|uniref:Uncharacterized protein n=1 Tax=Puccinia triticina TaxID=208348 RepID=A0ABY7CL57_9BASI|nr:uncharacterized protein PtA15_5A637 [Puccinia triticina]WAQ85063.1 hypothetical protein PtA15_5A637 [Puccinia triticina]WAR58393.1 hypothetical protein PtB15_5B627 [Puccinia triticina]
MAAYPAPSPSDHPVEKCYGKTLQKSTAATQHTTGKIVRNNSHGWGTSQAHLTRRRLLLGGWPREELSCSSSSMNESRQARYNTRHESGSGPGQVQQIHRRESEAHPAPEPAGVYIRDVFLNSRILRHQPGFTWDSKSSTLAAD